MAPVPATLAQALDLRAERPERGFRFVGTDRVERYFPYPELRDEVLRRAAHLHRAGLAKGDRLGIVVPEPHEFVLSFLGTVLAGAVPVPIYPRASFRGVDSYVDTMAHILEAAGARHVLTMDRMADIVGKLEGRVPGLEAILRTEKTFEGAAPDFHPPLLSPDDLCFLQFTSGSTSRPKGVSVTHANLVANSTAFLGPHGLDRSDDDVGVSWLPLYHDMGLIGFILGTLVCDIPVVILPTETFARMPRLWLETITRHRGTITYAPNFAYQLVTKRVRDRDLAELDLSSLRVAGCGAEPIRAQTLRDFAEKFRPAGFDDRALLPSYGMAESTLAVTFHPVGTPMVVDRVDAEAMKRGTARPADGTSRTVLEVVGCGRPFPGHELEIVDDGDVPRAEREVGEIVVRGPSVTAGYFGDEEATAEAWRGGWLHTGDLGYRAGGTLFVCGRIKDLVIIRGANHHPQDIEWPVGDVEGVRRGNVAAFSTFDAGEERLVVVAEGSSSDAPRLREQIAARIQGELGLVPHRVLIVPVGTLPKTSSGKPQRRRTRTMFEEGTLPAHP